MEVTEAIERIKDHKEIHFKKEPRAIKITEALDMAIEVLKDYKKDTDCEYCHTPFKHCGQLYIVAGLNNDPYLHIMRKEDSVGGAMIKYCPWCGRELDPWYG